MAEPLRLLSHLGAGDRRRAAEPDAKRRRQSAGAQAPLLPAAIDQRQQPYPRPAPDEERADSLRPVNLVAGNRQQVDLHRLDIERDLAKGLRRIGVEQHAPGAAQRADFGEWLDDPDLVVRGHHRHEERALGQRLFERGERDEAVRLDWKIGHREAFPLQFPAAFEHAFVLGLQGYDVIADLPALRVARAKCAAPLIARLFASVAPEVKTISRGSAWISAAISPRARSIASAAIRP